MKRHIRFFPEEQVLTLLDQRYLPDQEKWFVCRRLRDVIEAMQKMVIRGAPAIGVVAAYGCCLSAATLDPGAPEWQKELDEKLKRLAQARPTAVNLTHAVGRMRDVWKSDADIKLDDLLWLWTRLARDIHSEDISTNKAIGESGKDLLQDGDSVMTHCNAGALATGGYGTALGVFRAARSAGKELYVIANETRPLLQGSRITAYELEHDGFSVRVACDNAAGYLMSRGYVDKVVVGADRITLNGDTVNKIGTYSLAILAFYHQIPFYVAAPSSTFDPDTLQGEDVPIEERNEREVSRFGDYKVVPDGVGVLNYAFDITPHSLITGIITEKGVLGPPYIESIKDTIFA
ncbi:MAG: S-methyl-5-thioribose-1-phosphate isomerase [Thermodesulfobacteriota bacterium]